MLNSDASVEKYRIPQEEFQKTAPLPVNVVNLADDKWEAADIEEMLYDEDPELIYCIGTRAYLVAHTYLSKTPTVFSSIINWLRLPITEGTYGISNELHAGMEMMLFRYIFPEVERIGVLYSKKYTGEWFNTAQEHAKEIEITIVGYDISKRNAIPTLKKLLPGVDAFWLISDPELISNKDDLKMILDVCDAGKIPVFSYHEAFAQYGAILTISEDIPTIGRQAAVLAMELLRGEKPEEHVQFPAGSYIVLNLKKVKEYQVSYNEDALGSVNTVIEK